MQEICDFDETFFSIKDTLIIIFELTHNKEIFDLIEGSFEDELITYLDSL